jgi:hypothetical protein
MSTGTGTERSGPPVRLPERRGFGSTVIGTMAKQTVSGEVQLNYASSGLEWRLTCPAVNALEPEEREATWKRLIKLMAQLNIQVPASSCTLRFF